MTRTWPLSYLALALLALAASARADQKGDIAAFDLTAVAPPVPAMRYELLVDPIDQQSGNAADFYQKVFPLLTPELLDEIDKADDACQTAGFEPLNSLEIKLSPKTQAIFDLLEQASRQDHCDWNSQLRAHGFATPLPYLNHVRALANMMIAQTAWQIRQGETVEAMATLRLDFALGQNCAMDPTMVGTLVGIGINAIGARGVIELMNQPGAPNLYWALATLPQPLVSPRKAMEGERFGLFATIPVLVKARAGELSADEWRAVFKGLADILGMDNNSKPVSMQSLIDGATPLLPVAKDYYAKTRKLPASEVDKIEPIKVLGAYCLEQYQIQQDDAFKLLELPYPVMLPKMQECSDALRAAMHAHRGNPFLAFFPSYSRALAMTMRINRQIAALTAVEAIRSYAAANQGKLPGKLSDIVDTPAPDNPRTGQPFDYSVQGETATLSDAEPKDWPLSYTIRIRK